MAWAGAGGTDVAWEWLNGSCLGLLVQFPNPRAKRCPSLIPTSLATIQFGVFGHHWQLKPAAGEKVGVGAGSSAVHHVVSEAAPTQRLSPEVSCAAHEKPNNLDLACRAR